MNKMHTDAEDLTEDERYEIAAEKARVRYMELFWEQDRYVDRLEEEYGLETDALKEYRIE